jgi:hypothetical protein
LEQTFFGFSPEDRPKLHENIFNLIWHGAGRWDWDTIYNMPIHIRKFWIKKINKLINEEEEAHQKQVDEIKRKRNSIPKRR